MEEKHGGPCKATIRRTVEFKRLSSLLGIANGGMQTPYSPLDIRSHSNSPKRDQVPPLFLRLTNG